MCVGSSWGGRGIVKIGWRDLYGIKKSRNDLLTLNITINFIPVKYHILQVKLLSSFQCSKTVVSVQKRIQRPKIEVSVIIQVTTSAKK